MHIVTMPDRVARRPRHGDLPILYTTLIRDGVPDFRVTDPDRGYRAFASRLCAVCGEPVVPEPFVFLVGLVVLQGERISPENPGHEECMRYALSACPYLAGGRARRERNLPEEAITAVYHAPVRPKLIYLAWTPGYRLRLVEDVWYALCEPWLKWEAAR